MQVPTLEVQDTCLPFATTCPFVRRTAKSAKTFPFPCYSVSHPISLFLIFQKRKFSILCEKLITDVYKQVYYVSQRRPEICPTYEKNESGSVLALVRSHTHRPKVQCTITHTFWSFVFNRMFFVTLAPHKVNPEKSYFIKNIDVLVPFMNCYKLKT